MVGPRSESDPRFAQAKYDPGWIALGAERDKQDRKAAADERRLYESVMLSCQIYDHNGDYRSPEDRVPHEQFVRPAAEARDVQLSAEDIAAMDEGF